MIFIGYKARNSYELWALSYEMARFICHEYMCVYVAVFKWLELTMRFVSSEVHWQSCRKDGKYESTYIEGILYVRQAASRKAGGQGIRYVCEVEGSIAVLFHDEPHWFIEQEESVSKA